MPRSITWIIDPCSSPSLWQPLLPVSALSYHHLSFLVTLMVPATLHLQKCREMCTLIWVPIQFNHSKIEAQGKKRGGHFIEMGMRVQVVKRFYRSNHLLCQRSERRSDLLGGNDNLLRTHQRLQPERTGGR